MRFCLSQYTGSEITRTYITENRGEQLHCGKSFRRVISIHSQQCVEHGDNQSLSEFLKIHESAWIVALIPFENPFFGTGQKCRSSCIPISKNCFRFFCGQERSNKNGTPVLFRAPVHPNPNPYISTARTMDKLLPARARVVTADSSWCVAVICEAFRNIQIWLNERLGTNNL